MRRARSGVAVVLAALSWAGCSAAVPPSGAVAAGDVARGCPPERAQDGEARLVFLGDSGYGQGFAEWGLHGQEAIASRLNSLRLAPDLVLFLGDNVYWLGSKSLYKARFDDIYDPLIRGCKVHVALGNHDVKGCRVIEEREQWQSCLGELRAALLADREARYLRQGLDEVSATARAEADVVAASSGQVGAEAVAAAKGNCLPGDASAYNELVPNGNTCNATPALTHAQFGFGGVERETARQTQRYYSMLWPLPRLAGASTTAGAASAGAEQRPLVNVIALDSNTLRVADGMLEGGAKPREDQLQLLFLRSALAQWRPRAKEAAPWRILMMHHPPYTPRGCVCRLFGACVAPHTDEPGLAKQLRDAWEDLEPPDLVMTAHNHAYARSHPLDAAGTPVKAGTGGVRYFVSGGGGAPLYAIDQKDARFAKAFTAYHFVYFRLTQSAAFFWVIDGVGKVRDSGCFRKGSNVDHALRPEFRYDDPLPAQCEAPGP
jgi:hypothetical protein